MKLKKKSGLMGAVIALSAASLVSVGFASWVISQSDTATLTGNIQVDVVEDDRYLIRNADGGNTFALDYGTNKAGKAANAIVFGWDNTGVDAADVWLENDDIATTEKTKAENLTASVDLYLYKPNATSYSASDLEVSVDILDDDQLAAWTAAEGLYVAPLANVASIEVSAVEPAALDGNGSKLFKKVTLNLEFDWGTKFGGDNPYIYYNDGEKTADAYGDEAIAALEVIETLANIQFTVSVAWAD